MILVKMQNLKFPIQKRTSQRNSIFTPLQSSKTPRKSLSMPENNFFLAKNYTPLWISLAFKQNKNLYVQFFETCHFNGILTKSF